MEPESHPEQESPDLITVGRVIKPFGLRGQIVIFPLTDFPERFASGVSMADLVRAAPRPRYSALDVSKFEGSTGSRLRSWNETLSSYLKGKSN